MTVPSERALAYTSLVARIEKANWQSMVREIALAQLHVYPNKDQGLPVDPLDELRLEILAIMPETYRAAVVALTKAMTEKDKILTWKP